MGPYEVLAPLGAGGMGEVYRARDTRLRREVAVKVLPESLSQDQDRLRRFEQEALAASALNHPNILTIHDIGSEAGSPYVVSELLEGQTLREALSKGALPEGTAVEYGVQIVNGMAAAHEKGIVHRDLKPENIFVTRDGLVKILDFGLAKLTHPERRVALPAEAPTFTAATEPGVVMGTIGYMSPEQVKGAPADARSCETNRHRSPLNPFPLRSSAWSAAVSRNRRRGGFSRPAISPSRCERARAFTARRVRRGRHQALARRSRPSGSAC